MTTEPDDSERVGDWLFENALGGLVPCADCAFYGIAHYGPISQVSSDWNFTREQQFAVERVQQQWAGDRQLREEVQ